LIRRPSGGRPWAGTIAALAALMALVGACSGGDEATSPPPAATETPGDAAVDSDTADDGVAAETANDGDGTGGDQQAGTDTPPGAGTRVEPGELPVLDGGRIITGDLDGPSAELITLSDEPRITAARYPRPTYEANPWSHWGQGIALDDGRVITAIGDHLGADGNSYLFLYDPDANTLTRIADVMSALDHEPGSWGYGKIHSQMVDAGDGGVYFTTYYGTRRGLTYSGSYAGDVLFRLDTQTLDLQPLSVPVPGHGIPSLATNGSGLLYGEAVNPLLPDEQYPGGGLLVFDTSDPSASRFLEDPRHRVFRNVMTASDGTAWFAGDAGSLLRYDPVTGAVSVDDATTGRASLRASTGVASDGTIYGVTLDPFDLFAFRPGEDPRPLGQALDYTTSLALTPDEGSVLYVPGAHGDAPTFDAALLAVDTASGDQTVVVELFDLLEDEFGVVVGGTYSITVDPDRNHAHIVFNAGATADEPWGELLFVVVELP
ncbi:MAG: hypothetical protein AAGK32_04140, partial [Actinomycetota bacterium]